MTIYLAGSYIIAMYGNSATARENLQSNEESLEKSKQAQEDVAYA